MRAFRLVLNTIIQRGMRIFAYEIAPPDYAPQALLGHLA
jgi:hypothetical protein